MAADGEVVEGLKLAVAEAQDLVDKVVEETPHAGAAQAGGFGLKVEELAEHAGFLEEDAVGPRAGVLERVVECGEHGRRECAVGCDGLSATQLPGQLAAVAGTSR